jgi:hypothetical protein
VERGKAEAVFPGGKAKNLEEVDSSVKKCKIARKYGSSPSTLYFYKGQSQH